MIAFRVELVGLVDEEPAIVLGFLDEGRLGGGEIGNGKGGHGTSADFSVARKHHAEVGVRRDTTWGTAGVSGT